MANKFDPRLLDKDQCTKFIQLAKYVRTTGDRTSAFLSNACKEWALDVDKVIDFSLDSGSLG